MEELREAKMVYCFPESEEEETEEIDGRLIELEEPFVCDENEREEKCNERFANHRHDCVTTRPKILRNFNCTRDSTTLARKDLSRPAMSAWRVSKRATPEGEGSSARDSKLPKNGGKGSMRASARSAASYEDSPGRSIVALQKLSLKHDQKSESALWR